MTALHILVAIGIALLILPTIFGYLRRKGQTGSPSSCHLGGFLCLGAAVLLGFFAYIYVVYTTLNADFDALYGWPNATYIRVEIPRAGKVEPVLLVDPSPSALRNIEELGSWVPITRIEAVKLFIETGLRSK